MSCFILLGIINGYAFQKNTFAVSKPTGSLPPSISTFSATMITKGQEGEDVKELQGRLKQIGLFTEKIDGKFGQKTFEAVKKFQTQVGLNVDGVVGHETEKKLKEKTKNFKPNQTQEGKTQKKDYELSSGKVTELNENEIKIMANAVYGEARGEPFEGQVAVAAVILNRVKAAEFPNTPTAVIFQPRAFTAVADGQIYMTPNEQAKKAVKHAIDGVNPVGKCLYYYNPKTATSKWIFSRQIVKRIGRHVFCI